MVSMELGLGLTGIAANIALALGLLFSRYSKRVSAAMKEQQRDDAIKQLKTDLNEAHNKLRDYEAKADERFKEIEGRLHNGDIVLAEMGKDVKQILKEIEGLGVKLDDHIRDGAK